MRILVLVLTLAVMLSALVFADEIRYVVQGPSPGGYPLWSNWVSFNNCARALTRGGSPADVQMFCQDGFSGIKSKVGALGPGTTVERLDTTECRDMVRIRVVTGELKGQTGCISGDALTSIKPE